MPAAPIKSFYTAKCGPDGKSRASDPLGAGVLPRLVVDQAAFSAALGSLQNLLTGGTFSFDLRDAAWLSGTDFATATFSITTVSGDSASGKNWAISTDDLVNTLADPGSVGAGVFSIQATDTLGANYSFGSFGWSVIAPVGTDTLAPAIPTWRSITPATNALNCVVTQSSDEYRGSIQASGVASYKAYKGGVLDQTVTAPAANVLGVPTTYNLGSISPTPTATQSGKTWTLTAAGTGIHNTAAEQCLAVGWVRTGAFKFRAKVGPFNGPGGNYAFSTVGLMVHETAAQGGRFIAMSLQPSDYTPTPIGINVQSRTAANAVGGFTDAQSIASGLTGPAWLEIERSADLSTLTCRYSTDGKLYTDIVAKPIAMTATVHALMFAASQVAGSQVTCPVTEVSLTQGDVSFSVSTTVAASISVSAIDVAGNESAQSAALSATPGTPPATGVKKFNPGHYIETALYGPYDYTARIQSNLAYLVGTPSPFRGVCHYMLDGAIEGDTPGDFTRGRVFLDNLLGTAQANGKKVMLVLDHYYGSMDPADFTGGKLFPKYLRDYPEYRNPADTLRNDGGLFRPVIIPSGLLGALERDWVPNVMDRRIAIGQWIAQNYDSHPALEMVLYGSMSIGFSADDTARAGFSYSAYFTQVKRWLVAMSQAFTTTLVGVKDDWPGSMSNALNLVATMRPYHICHSDYDSVDYTAREGLVTAGTVTNPESYGHAAFRGALLNNGGTQISATGSGGVDMRGKTCYVQSVQGPDWDRSPSRYGIQSIAEFADQCYFAGSTHVTWSPDNYSVTQGTFNPPRVGPTTSKNSQTGEFGTGGTIWANIIKPYLAANPSAGIRYTTKPTDLP
jgi:hypothetical protein